MKTRWIVFLILFAAWVAGNFYWANKDTPNSIGWQFFRTFEFGMWFTVGALWLITFVILNLVL